MAIGTNTVMEVRTTGSDTLNGGGFNPTRDPVNGVDRSQSDTAFVAIDGVTITATLGPTFGERVTVTGYTVSTADIGNLVNISGGSATPGIYEITSLQLGNVWNLDRSAGVVGQTATGGMGGCLATPGMASAALAATALPTVWIKEGTYLITSALTTVAGGCVNTSSGLWQGYGTTRGDLAARPILRASGITNATLVTINGNTAILGNIEVDGDNLSTIRGISLFGFSLVYLCIARNCTNSGFYSAPSGPHVIAFCYATGCSTAGAAFDIGGGYTAYVESCIAEGNTVHGFVSSTSVANCLAINNTGATTDGFYPQGAGLVNCTAYGNGRDGFGNIGNSANVRWINCISESNGRNGFYGGSGANRLVRINCATFGNVSGATGGSTPEVIINDIVGVSTFFIDAAGGNFTPNTVAGAGALLRGLSYISPFIGSIQETFRDVGAVQHEDGGGGGGGGGAHTGLPELGGTFG